MKNDDRDDWSKVQGAPPLEAPRWIGDELSTQVRRDLEPGYFFLLLKTLGVHLVAGSASLLICPQFGFHPLGLSFDPLAFLLAYGEWVCGLGCGIVFSGLTTLSLLFFLTRDERRFCSRQGFWLFTPVMSLSWVLLMALGNSHQHSHSISSAFSAFWLAGAVFFSWGVLALSSRAMSHRTP